MALAFQQTYRDLHTDPRVCSPTPRFMFLYPKVISAAADLVLQRARSFLRFLGKRGPVIGQNNVMKMSFSELPQN
jgi:hypothetical protein